MIDAIEIKILAAFTSIRGQWCLKEKYGVYFHQNSIRSVLMKMIDCNLVREM